MIGFILLTMTSMALTLNWVGNSLTIPTGISLLVLMLSGFMYKEKEKKIESSEDDDYYASYYQDL